MNFSENTREQRYVKAKEQVEKLKGFYVHATIYSVFVCIFIWLNIQSTSYPWAIFPIAGWGLGILGHAADTYQFNIFFNKDWEARKIKELMNKDNQSF